MIVGSNFKEEFGDDNLAELQPEALEDITMTMAKTCESWMEMMLRLNHVNLAKVWLASYL